MTPLKKTIGHVLFIIGSLACILVIMMHLIPIGFGLPGASEFFLYLAIPLLMTIAGHVILHEPKKKHEKSAKV